MAQRRSYEFQHLLVSEQINNAELAISPQGVYCGFDLKPTTDGSLTIILTPDYSLQKNDIGTSISVLKMPNGVIVEQSDDIVIPISASAQAYGRIDAIVCQHTFLGVNGGQEAVYSIIEGQYSIVGDYTTNGQYDLPIIQTQDLQNQLIIGYLFVGAGSTPATWRYFKNEIPSAGSKPITNKINRFTAMQCAGFPTTSVTVLPNTQGKLDIPRTGNIFYLTYTPSNLDQIKWLPDFRDNPNFSRQKGATITLIMDGTFIFEDTTNQLSTAPHGYKPIKTSIGAGFNVTDGDVSTIQVTNSGSITLIEEETQWRVISMIDEISHPNRLARILIESISKLKMDVLNIIKTNETNPYSVIRQVGTTTIDGNGNLVLSPNGQLFYVDTMATITGVLRSSSAGTVNLKEGDIVTIKFISDGAILQSSLSPASSQFIAIDATNGQNTIAIKANDTVVFEQSINGVLITNYPKRIVWQRTANPNQTSFVDSTNISFSFSNGFLYLKGTFRLIAANAVNEPALIKMFDFPTNSLTETYKLVIQNVLDSRYSQGFWGSNSAGINLRCVINTQGFFVPHDQFNGNGSAIGYQDFSVDGMIFSIS